MLHNIQWFISSPLPQVVCILALVWLAVDAYVMGANAPKDREADPLGYMEDVVKEK